MAHRRSSIKKIRTDKRRRLRNLSVTSELKTAARKLAAALKAKSADEATKLSREYFSKLDKAVKKNVIHKNRAARRKSRVSKQINALRKV